MPTYIIFGMIQIMNQVIKMIYPRLTHRLYNLFPSVFAAALLTICIIPWGCTHSVKETQAYSVESPRISGGSIISDSPDDGLNRIASALDDLNEPQIAPGILASINERTLQPTPPSISDETVTIENDGLQAIEDSLNESTKPTDDLPTITIPPNAGKLISLHNLSRSELSELLISLGLRYQTELGYQEATIDHAAMLGAVPEGVGAGPVFSRQADTNSIALLRFGSKRYLSQPPQLWALGVIVDPNNHVTVNPDIELVQAQVDATLAHIQQSRVALKQYDLDHKIIQLSYINTQGAINILKGLGINTVAGVENLPPTVEFNQLPMVAVMPAPSDAQIGLVGDKSTGKGSFGRTMTPTSISSLNSEVYAAPTSQLMVLFHPAHPEQFSLVKSLLDEFVDRPARIIFVEGLVLEISESGLKELGIEWAFKEGPIDWLIGSLDPTGVTDTITFSRLDSRDIRRDWGVTIRALVRDGKAEILSRPSVLTMNNRQATIWVGEDIPIATSQEGTSVNSNKVSFTFSYIPTGILLNIRPRMTASGNEVSMLVDTIVSSEVPGRDLEVRSTAGELLVSAPTISTRRVQTYARIADKTPFIIGGLVSKERTVEQDKVPILGDLPFIGGAFRSERTSTLKREVIIVLTPYILPEEHNITRSLPKDDDTFDSTDNQLFRDAYRIRAQDVFDLRFLAENKRLMMYRKLANEIISQNYQMALLSPYNAFANNKIPGEEFLVERMIYEVIKRTEVDERIDSDRIIFMEEKNIEGYSVEFLSRILANLGNNLDANSFFQNNPGKALAITYHYDRESMEQQRLASEPIPELSIVDCPDRDTWQRLLWDLNQPTPDGRQRFSIVLNSPKDIQRLCRALMLKEIVELNGGDESLSLSNFTTGKILLIPKMGNDMVTVLDADVARYFFHTELYYAAIIKKIENILKQFDAELKKSEILGYINNPADIPTPADSDESNP